MSKRRFSHPSESHFWHATTAVATTMKYAKSTNFWNAIAPSQLNKGIS